MVTKKYIVCPSCDDHTFCIDHLKSTDSTETIHGWMCRACVSSVKFKMNEAGDIEILDVVRPPPGKERLLVLLSADFQDPNAEKRVYLVVSKPNYSRGVDLATITKSERFYFDEHTCPTNYLGATIIEGDNDDPHGIFKFEEVIFQPEGFDTDDFHNSGGSYKSLFKSMKQ